MTSADTRIILAFLILFSSIVFTSCSENNQAENDVVGETIPAAELIAQSDELYKQRGENLQKVKDGLQLLRRARVADSSNYEAAWKIAKFSYFLGNHAKDEETRDKAFAEGIAAGKIATRLQPDKPDGYFWTGANLGGQAKFSLIDGAANIPEIRQNMQKVIELQPNYQGATAYVALAQIELKTRGILGGSPQKAVAYLEQALKLEKQNSLIYLHLAEAYLALNRKAEARKMLEAMYKLPKNDEYAFERREAEEKAQKLLAKL